MDLASEANYFCNGESSLQWIWSICECGGEIYLEIRFQTLQILPLIVMKCIFIVISAFTHTHTHTHTHIHTYTLIHTLARTRNNCLFKNKFAHNSLECFLQIIYQKLSVWLYYLLSNVCAATFDASWWQEKRELSFFAWGLWEVSSRHAGRT